MQLYRGFDIGTAKLSSTARAGIEHHLIDILNPDEIFSAGDYARAAAEAIAAISSRGHLPIMVGGTGFYLRAVVEGLPDLPGRDDAVRSRLRGNRRLHRLLQRLDPAAAARIHERDAQKLIRALEIRILTGGARTRSRAERRY